jgi:two-component system chemotaxis response regulator CheB
MGKPRIRSRIRLAVVDDSVFVRGALRRMFENDLRIAVVGCASSGEELLAKLDTWSPDVITLDLNMPGIGGMATLDRIQARGRIPVIVLSSCVGEEVAMTIEALCHDGVDFIDKAELSLADFSAMHRVLAGRIEALAGAERSTAAPEPPLAVLAAPADVSDDDDALPRSVAAVVIGASTGGPQGIERILLELDARLPVPVVIAQHMPAGFTAAFARRLDSLVAFSVREARNGEALAPGVVLVAPGGSDLRLVRDGSRVVASIAYDGGPVVHRPSVDLLFNSAAAVFGASALGVILSGMGSDGARGLAELRRAGAQTLAQDESTCVVYGMPGAAVARGAVSEILPLPRIASRLKRTLRS